MSQADYHDVYKRMLKDNEVVMLGDSGVGKTNIINNFVKGTAGNQPKGPTVGIEYSSKTIAIDSSRTIKMQIWDTAGQEQYRSLTTNQLKKALGAFVVYDMTNRRTFESLVYWVKQLREMAIENVSIVIVANKLDRANSRQVSRQQGQQLASNLKVAYSETSANDIRSLNTIFIQLCQMIAHGKQAEQHHFTKDNIIPPLDKNHPISQDTSPKSKCC